MMNEFYETGHKVPPADSGFGSMSNLATPTMSAGTKSFSEVNGCSDSPVPTSPYPPSPAMRPFSNTIQNVINNNSSSLNSSRNSSPLLSYSNVSPSPIPQSQLPPEGLLRPNFSKPTTSSPSSDIRPAADGPPARRTDAFPSFSSSQMPNNNQFQNLDSNRPQLPALNAQVPRSLNQNVQAPPLNNQISNPLQMNQNNPMSQFTSPTSSQSQARPPASSVSQLFPPQMRQPPVQSNSTPTSNYNPYNTNIPLSNAFPVSQPNQMRGPTLNSSPKPIFPTATSASMPHMLPPNSALPPQANIQPVSNLPMPPRQQPQSGLNSQPGYPPQPRQQHQGVPQMPAGYPQTSQPGLPPQQRMSMQPGVSSNSGSLPPGLPPQTKQATYPSNLPPHLNQPGSMQQQPGYNPNISQSSEIQSQTQNSVRSVPPSLPPSNSNQPGLANQPRMPPTGTNFSTQVSQPPGINNQISQSNQQLPPSSMPSSMQQRYPPQSGISQQPTWSGLPSQPGLPPQPGMNSQSGFQSQPGMNSQLGFQQQPGMNSQPGFYSQPGLPPQPGNSSINKIPTSGLQSQPGLPPQPAFSTQRPHQSPVPPLNSSYGQYPQQYNGNQQSLTQEMGRMSVSNSYNKQWGYETVDIMQCRNILPEEKVEPPPIKLNNQFAQSANASTDIFRCTLNKIPETNNLLQKSRLPLGILIHPFKDLTHLPVIQCSTIVRCRACRTYINPFVYFIDSKRWKCNLCYRVNDLPEDFQYDPVTKSYGDPTRRPEIQSATIEYIAPSEYMLRPPQPAAYLFVLDVSAAAAESGYLKVFCDTLAENIDSLPGDSRTVLAFICFDTAVHFYYLGEGCSRPKEMTVIDIDEIFLPSPEDLLVNLAERKQSILELINGLPKRHGSPPPSSTQSALGAALQAAHKLLAPIGGRVSVFQSCLPNVGPGALTAREDPNNRSSKDVAHLNPATDFYKRLALDCSAVQVAVDFFLLNSQYADLSTMSGISKFSGGSVFHFPLFKASRDWQSKDFKNCLVRYFTRKIGFEAVMRIRCTRGLAIHTFHGNFFVRSTDLLSLPNISPDVGFGMQISIEESLSDPVCFQAGVLYTSSKGERRIRVHTLCLPVATTLSDVIHSADQQCIVGLLAKMAVDRSESSSLSDAREALINAAVDALGVQQISSGPSPGLMSPMALRLLPLYLMALLKHPAFRIGTSTRLDDRVAAMCNMKSLPLDNLIRAIYPDLYPIHQLSEYPRPTHLQEKDEDDEVLLVPSPPRLQLSAEKINANGAYLLDQENIMLIYIGRNVNPQWIQKTLGVDHHSYIGDNWHSIPVLETEENNLLHAFINHLNDDRAYSAAIHVITDNSPSRKMFTERLLDDRVESALSYYEFLQHIKTLLK